MDNLTINFATRQLMRSSTRGYLGTQLFEVNKNTKALFSSKQNFIPYNTFVMVAFDYDASPLLILSDLSEHTKNINKNNFVSLLLYEEQKFTKFFPVFENKFDKNIYEDPMSRPRLTIIGKIDVFRNPNAKRRFLYRHPASKLYANFNDMNLYRIKIVSAHLTAGFAKVKWFEHNDLKCNSSSDFEKNELEILTHMNEHHSQSIKLYMKKFFNKNGKWEIVGIDPEGFDLRFKSNVLRYNFENTLKSSNELRKIFVKLHKTASSN